MGRTLRGGHLRLATVFSLVAVALMCVPAIASADSDLVVNGRFQQPMQPAGGWSNVGMSMPGWTATNGCGIELWGNNFIIPSPYEAQVMELNSNCPSGVYQTISDTANEQYLVTYYFGARPGTSASDNIITPSWNGASQTTQQTTNTTLQQYSFKVTGTGSDTLKFASGSPCCTSVGTLLALVSVVPANQGPQVEFSPSNVSGQVGTSLSTTGQFASPDGLALTVTASVGSVTANSTGAFTWTYTPTTAAANVPVTITATDPSGRSAQATFTYTATGPTVALAGASCLTVENGAVQPFTATVSNVPNAGNGFYVTVDGSPSDPWDVSQFYEYGLGYANGNVSVNNRYTPTSVPLGTSSLSLDVRPANNQNLVEGSLQVPVCPDTTPPVITPVVSGTQGAGGWYTSDVGVHWSVSDPESAISNETGCADQTITSDTDGTTFTCTATSAGGTASKSVTITRDATAPATTDDAPTGWQNGPVTVHLTALDSGSGVASTHYSVDNGPDQTGTSVSIPAPADGSNDESHTISYYSVDNAGNQEAAHTVAVQIDTTPPSTTDDAPAGWQNGPVTVHLAATDGMSGVAATHYTVDGGGDHTGSSVSLTTDGTHTISYYSVDNAGNQEAAHTTTVEIDTTPPRTTDDAPSGWQNSPVTVHLSASDGNGSGVAATHYSVDGGGDQTGSSVSLTTDGTHSISYYSVDNVGNQEAAHTVTVEIDTTPPRTTDDAPSGWQNGPVTVHLSASDGNGSGVAGTYYRVDHGTQQPGTSVSIPAPSDHSNDGSHTISYYSVDNAGNQETAHTAIVRIDTTPPTISGMAKPAANSYGWNNTPVTVSFSCADEQGGSGLAGCTGEQTLSSEGAGQSVTGTATDNAGNSSQATVGNINIDLTPPVVSYSGNAGTYTVADSVNISCSATDALSGIASQSCKDITGDAYTFALGENDFSASATDKAGNVGSAKTSFTVTVSTDTLCTLTKRWVTQAGIATSLCAKLSAAQASIARGDQNSKSGQLGAYRNELSAQSGKSVPADKAAILATLSQSL